MRILNFTKDNFPSLDLNNILPPYFTVGIPLLIGSIFTFTEWWGVVLNFLFYLSLMAGLPQLYFEFKKEKLNKLNISFHKLFRESKKELIITALLFFVPAAVSFLFISPSAWFLKMYFSLIVAALVSLSLNFFFKSSYHLVLLGVYFTTLWFFIKFYVFLFLPVLYVLINYKHNIGHHSYSQMILGLVIGILTTFLMFVGL